MLKNAVTEALYDLKQIHGLVHGFQTLRDKGLPHGIETDFSIFTGVDAAQLRLFEHCTAIIRTYTIFERLIYQLAEGWLKWIAKNQPAIVFTNPTCRVAYEIGLAEIFKRQTEPRFSGIDRFNLAKSHSLFDSKNPNPSFTEIDTTPFFATYPNLQIAQICSLFCNVAIGSPEQWLSESSKLTDLREEYSLGHIEALKEIVQRRNEFAHGNPDPGQLLGTNDLIARIEIISEIGVALHHFIVFTILTSEMGNEFGENLIGTVTKQWPRIKSVELLTASPILYVGEKILVVEKSEIYADEIKSIRVENQPAIGFYDLRSTYLGIQLHRMPKKGAKLIRSNRVRDMESLL